MNKKALIILFTTIIVAAIGVGVTIYILSFRTVAFDIVPENISVTILDQSGENEITTLEQDDTLRLQDGTYVAKTSHADYSTDPLEFTVKDGDITVNVDPAFSDARLQTMIKTEADTVERLLRQTYPDVINNFSIQPGKLYEKGQWYATILQQNPLPGNQPGDAYRVVLYKQDDKWKVVAGPEIVLSTQKYPDIPFAILTDINAQ